MVQYFLGIDIGGTNIKIGVVDSGGKILYKKKYSVEELRKKEGFIEGFLYILAGELNQHSEIKRVGIGVPGLLSKDRRVTIEMPNLFELNGLNFLEILRKNFPGINFHIENDANTAALGEYHFSELHLPDDFIFVTLGTGVGGGVIMDGKIFKGGGGNGMEIGHMVARNGKTVEKNIGKKGMVGMAHYYIQQGRDTLLKDENEIDSKKIIKAARQGDEMALQIFKDAGVILGEALVSLIRVLDIKKILIGGGVAKTFEFFYDDIEKTLQKHLTEYYLKEIEISKAILGNNAGIIGAASLCFLD